MSKEVDQQSNVQDQLCNIIRMPSEGQAFRLRGTKFEVIKVSGFNIKCKAVYDDN